MESETTNDAIFKKVVLVNGFQTQYLDFNRRLELSPEQLQALRYRERNLLRVAIGCLLPLPLAVLLPGTLSYSLALFGVICAATLFYFYTLARRDFNGLQVALVDGMMSRDKQRGRSRVADFYYFYIVDNLRFRVSEDAYTVLTQDIPVRAYYAPGSMTLLNMDLLDKAPEHSDSLGLGQLPHTDF